MRITVIGGTGHIGTYLVPRLVEAGHDVVNVSRGERSPYRDDARWGDVWSASFSTARPRRPAASSASGS